MIASLAWRAGRDLGVVILFANLFLQADRAIQTGAAGHGMDFVAFAAASRMLVAGSHCLYCAAPLHAAENAYRGAVTPTFAAFLNPPLAAFVLVPIAELPRAAGTAAFVVASLLAMGVGAWLLAARLGCPPLPTLVAVLSLPVAFSIAEGQWDALLFLALVGALVLLTRWPVVAGVLLSVLAVKMQAVWLVPLVLIAMGRWRVLLGMGIGAAMFAGSDVAIMGWGHWLDWPRTMLQTGSAEESWNVGLPYIAASLWGSGAGFAAFAGLAAVAVLGTFRLRVLMRREPAVAIAAAVCLSLLLGPHSLPQDFLLLVPALALASRGRVALGVAAGVCLSLAYLASVPVPLLNLGTLALAAVTGLAVAYVVRAPNHLQAAGRPAGGGVRSPVGAPPAVRGRGLPRGRDDTRQEGSISPGVTGHL